MLPSDIITLNKEERDDIVDLTRKLAISYYKTIATINEPHCIYLVQHQETQKIYIKKVLDVYNLDVYKQLYQNHIIGTPKIIDYCEDDNQLIIIEEYISGCSLQEKIQSSELSQKDILNYMLDLCNILKQLHNVKPAVIHRDIKPSNVIITNYNRAVLLDFNAAKYYSSSSTEDTVLLGTQGYAAPEQYGFGASSPQTDIYSLGVLMKEMQASAGSSSSNLSPIIEKCTQINPSERYKDIGELKEELETLANPGQKREKPKSLLNYVPPGFRTKTAWKMILAATYYLFTFWLCLSLEVDNTSGFALWLERIVLLIIGLFIPCGCFNYMNVQKHMPLCQHSNPIVRYIGIALLDLIVSFSLIIILFIIEAMFFPV